MLKRKHYYFATHLTDGSIKTRLEAGAEYQKIVEKEKELLDLLIKNYHARDKNKTVINYCEDFIENHSLDLKKLKEKKGYRLKYFLRDYIGFRKEWGSSKKSFGKPYGENDHEFAEEISESDLINEMTDQKGSIKELLDASGGDRKMLKPFLPYIIISLNTNTRDRAIMNFEHTGRFIFDIDKIGDEKEALLWIRKLWKGTKNIKPYLIFLSPSGNGIKLACQLDITQTDFKNDFGSKERESVFNHHKIWYNSAIEELKASFPELEISIDEKTSDPTRPCFIPFVHKPEQMNYDPSVFSNYTEIVDEYKRIKEKQLQKELKKNSSSINKIMKENGIKSEKDAYHLHLKNRKNGFNVPYELDKLRKVIDYMIEVSKKDATMRDWLRETFTNYGQLNKLSWILYGVFGEEAIEEIKRLIPNDSNKLDPSDGDYRWSIRNENDYTDEQRANLTPGYFYTLVFQRKDIKTFVTKNFPYNSAGMTEFNLLNQAYNEYNLELDDSNCKKSDFLNQITHYINKNKTRLPLIQEWEDLKAEVELGPNDYLDKEVMEDLFQNKYGNKKVFLLRSQCGK